MIKSVTLLWLILAVAVSGALFRVSYRVQHLERHLIGINKQIAQEQESIRVLQAEWSYLNDPARLETLARKHLDLRPTSPSQIVTLDQIPNKLPAALVNAPPATAGKAIPAPSAKPIMATYNRRTTDD
jgi:cell division protein FtsL